MPVTSYHPDGTLVQHDTDTNYVWEVAQDATTLIWRGGPSSGYTRGYENHNNTPWSVARVGQRDWHVVVSCDCPRHQGEVTFHASN